MKHGCVTINQNNIYKNEYTGFFFSEIPIPFEVSFKPLYRPIISINGKSKAYKKITLYKVVVISVIVLLIGAAIYNGYGIIEDCGVQDAECLGS